MERGILAAYDLDFCKGWTEDKIRRVYNGEKKEVLDALILAVTGKAPGMDVIKAIPEVKPIKTIKAKRK